MSDSRKAGVSFERFYAFDSTTIRLFTEVLKGVGRNPAGEGKKKGGLKVHMLTDVHADVAKFARISEAKQHDKNFLKYLNLPKGSMIVFDKAYNHYSQFAAWARDGINFVCRLKDNAIYEVQEVLSENTLPDKQSGVLKEEHIHLKYAEKKNGIKTQVWCTLIAYLLLTVLKRLFKSLKAFSTVAALIRIHLISHLDLFWVIENGRRTYVKRTKSRNKSPDAVQLFLF